MLLKTNQRVFSIFQTLRSSKDVNVYLANDTQVDNKQFLVNEIHNPDIIRACIEDMLAFKKETSFSAFVDVFTSESKLYVVFTYLKPYQLKDYIDRHNLSFDNRIKLLEQYLVELSLYTRYPWAVLASLTDTENINVYADETIYFNFALHPQYLYYPPTKAIVYRNIAHVVETLFPTEISTKKGRQLAVIIDKCKKSLYKSIPEIAKEVQHVDNPSFKEKWKRFFATRKSQLQALKSISFTLLIVFLIVVVYSRFISPSAVKPLQPAVPVNQIGEIVLYEDSSESSEDTQQADYVAEKPSVIQVQMD